MNVGEILILIRAIVELLKMLDDIFGKDSQEAQFAKQVVLKQMFNFTA